jgi:hypothetical protein
MLRYLLHFKVPCPDVHAHVQAAADQGRVRVLIFFLEYMENIVDDHGDPVPTQYPHLDLAIMNNRLPVVDYVLHLVDKRGVAPMIIDPPRVVHHLLVHGHDRMLHRVCPRVVATLPARVITDCQATPAHLLHTTIRCIPVDAANLADMVPVVTAFAGGGRLEILHYCVARFGQDILTDGAFHAALCHGRVDVVRWMSTTSRQVPTVTGDVVEAICRNGHDAALRILPDGVPIPATCQRLARLSGNLAIVHEARRRSLHTTPLTCDDVHEMIVAAVPALVIVYLYHEDGLEAVHCDTIRLAVRHRRYALLAFWLDTDSSIDVDDTFLLGCTRGDVAVVRLTIGYITSADMLSEGLSATRVASCTIADRACLRELISQRMGSASERRGTSVLSQ